MEIDIRLAIESDAEELARLNQAFNGGEVRTKEEVIASLRESRELVAVATVDGQLVGFACAQYFRSFCYEELQGEITEMYVKDDARRKGIATGLLNCLETQLEQRGVLEIKILTNKRNEAAIRTYEQNHYIKENEIVLMKELGK